VAAVTSKNSNEKDLKSRLAYNVRRAREDAGLTQERAAKLVAMHGGHWQKIEAGKVNATLSTVVRVARALRVDPSDLLARVSA